MRVLCASLVALAFSAVASAQLQYGTSFEASEGFAPGDLDTQGGWAGDLNYDVVDTFAHTGTQSVRWTGQDGTYAWVDLATPYDGAQALSMSYYLYIDAATANAERVFGLRLFGNDAGGTYTGGAGVTVDADGTVRVGTTYDEMWDDTNIAGTVADIVGRWIEVAILYTPGAASAQASIDGNVFNIATVEEVAEVVDVDFFSDWRNENVDSTAYFDDYTIEAVPEPATMAALGLGVAAVLRRRNRR